MPLHLEALTPAARGLAPRLFPHIAGAGFIMAGGTALALQIGHRVSVDFDFEDADKDPEPVYLGAESAWAEIKEYFRKHTREHTQCMRETFGA